MVHNADATENALPPGFVRVEGTLELTYDSDERSPGKWSPGKLYLVTAAGPVVVSFWPIGEWDDATKVKVTRIPLEMGPEWEKLKGVSLGSHIRLVAKPDGEFKVKYRGEYRDLPQYKDPVIKGIDGVSSEAPVAPAPAPAPAPPAPAAPAAPAPPIDGPRWGQNLNIAVQLTTTYPDLSDDELFAKATSLAVKFYSQTPQELWQMVLAERASKEESQPEPDFIASLGTLSEEN